MWSSRMWTLCVIQLQYTLRSGGPSSNGLAQSGDGWIKNLMATDGPDVTVRSYLKLLNVKANHRKVVVSEKTAIVSSGNIHDASAYHSNIAFEVTGPIIGDILQSEQAVLDISGGGEVPAYTPFLEFKHGRFANTLFN